MNPKLLFDTSIWIDFFTGNETEQTKILTRFLKDDLPIFICPTILQEILQGVKKDKHFLLIKESLLKLEIIQVDPVGDAIGAATIYRKLRKKGITIRKSNDCLIAWQAIKNQIRIIHNDRDFDLILNNLDSLKS